AGVGRISFDVLGVPRERVAGDVEADGLLLEGEPLAFAPLFLAEDALLRRGVEIRFRAAAEEAELTGFTILLRVDTLLQGGLDRFEQGLVRLAGEVERARRDQRLQRLLGYLVRVDARAEVEQPGERLLAGAENGVDGVLAHALDRTEAEADEL